MGHLGTFCNNSKKEYEDLNSGSDKWNGKSVDGKIYVKEEMNIILG